MKRLTITILVFLGFLISISIWGCQGSTIIIGDEPQVREVPKKGPPPWAPAHGHRAKYRYYYYPDAYVYFDTGRRIYFYYQNNQWRFSASLPSGIHITVGEYVALEMDTDKPYQFHSDVAKSYPPGHLKKAGKNKDKDKGKGKNKGKNK